MDFFAFHPHWFWFMFFMAFFPRLTMLFTGICTAGWSHIVLFWFGWVLTPRLTVAILATFFYFHTNPVVCIFTWLWALGGEGAEKKAARRRSNGNRSGIHIRL
jgi:hypothetical protein